MFIVIKQIFENFGSEREWKLVKIRKSEKEKWKTHRYVADRIHAFVSVSFRIAVSFSLFRFSFFLIFTNIHSLSLPKFSKICLIMINKCFKEARFLNVQLFFQVQSQLCFGPICILICFIQWYLSFMTITMFYKIFFLGLSNKPWAI